MPHLFLPHRERKFALGFESSDKLWEHFNLFTYLIGGLAFVIGSIFFLPQYSNLEVVGAWIFIIASIFYLIVSLHDIAELRHHHGGHLPMNIDTAAALNYIIGSILFIAGSVLFLPSVDQSTPGAWCFIIGSVDFLAGGLLNGLQIFETSSSSDARYMLLVAMSFIVGSVMFLVPSIPYLFTFYDTKDSTEIYTFLASIYIAGSVCFTLGGVFCVQRYRASKGAISEPELQESLMS